MFRAIGISIILLLLSLKHEFNCEETGAPKVKAPGKAAESPMHIYHFQNFQKSMVEKARSHVWCLLFDCSKHQLHI